MTAHCLQGALLRLRTTMTAHCLQGVPRLLLLMPHMTAHCLQGELLLRPHMTANCLQGALLLLLLLTTLLLHPLLDLLLCLSVLMLCPILPYLLWSPKIYRIILFSRFMGPPVAVLFLSLGPVGGGNRCRLGAGSKMFPCWTEPGRTEVCC